ncbi:MAG: hypothetical protein R3F35_05175 [Myxococcota bacterium]
MHRRPFLVLPGGDCIPLEGDWRIEPLRGEWYVLGHHAVFRFDTEDEARTRLAHLRGNADPDTLAALTLELTDDPGEATEAASARERGSVAEVAERFLRETDLH